MHLLLSKSLHLQVRIFSSGVFVDGDDGRASVGAILSSGISIRSSLARLRPIPPKTWTCVPCCWVVEIWRLPFVLKKAWLIIFSLFSKHFVLIMLLLSVMNIIFLKLIRKQHFAFLLQRCQVLFSEGVTDRASWHSKRFHFDTLEIYADCSSSACEEALVVAFDDGVLFWFGWYWWPL